MRVVLALVLSVDERFDLDAVRMNAYDPPFAVLAWNANVVAKFQLGPRDVVPCHGPSVHGLPRGSKGPATFV